MWQSCDRKHKYGGPLFCTQCSPASLPSHSFQLFWPKNENCLPGGGSQSSDECLQQPANENEGVLPSDDEVEQRQDKRGMDDQATNHSNSVHSQLAAHGCDVIHLHDLSGDQKQDADRGVPKDQ